MPVAALTAWFSLIETGHLKAGETVLVQGTGGVALFGLQIAQAFGARAIVTSRSAEKLERAKALGASAVIDTSSAPDWSDAALNLTGGRIAQIGFLEGSEIVLPAVPMMLKRAIIQGIAVGHRRAFEDMNRAIDEHGIKPVIDKVYVFEAVHAAFDHLERGPFGKVVVGLRNE